MPRYTLNHAYEAYRDGLRFGPWLAGDEVSLDPDQAQWVERDSPGALTEIDDAPLPVLPGVPVPANGARPRVSGDDAEATERAKELIDAESDDRQTPPEEAPRRRGRPRKAVSGGDE